MYLLYKFKIKYNSCSKIANNSTCKQARQMNLHSFEREKCYLSVE